MGSKKRKKPAKRRQGMSGNPAVRAEQIEREQVLSGGPEALFEDLDPDEARELADAMRQLSQAMEGNPDPSPWWPQSYERVLERARAAVWPDNPAGIEETTCAIIGAQLVDNFAAHDEGHYNTPWLMALAGHVEEMLADDPGNADSWRPLWALLRGLVLTAPMSARGTEGVEAATTLAARGLAGDEWPVPEAWPCGDPLIARDTYGCRFLIAAPFCYSASEDYSGAETDHWYAWDIDECWLNTTVAAGTFESSQEALAEWRQAVGTPAAGAEFEPYDARLARLLLDPLLNDNPLLDMPEGNEPPELLREYFRSRRRAQVLDTEGFIVGRSPQGDGTIQERKIRNAFRNWHASRYGKRTAEVAQAAETIISEWGPREFLQEEEFYGCSPHRVEYAAHMIGNGYVEDYAVRAVRLLPDWVQWCAERRGLGEEETERALAAARTAAEFAEAKGTSSLPDPSAEGMPFRRSE